VCLYISFDQDQDSIFFSFWSIKPAMLPTSMLRDYSTSVSSMPSATLPATMLGYYSMSASSMPSKFFHRRFNLLKACFL
jgi:hypothetical protein